jgi:hypothetical protein
MHPAILYPRRSQNRPQTENQGADGLVTTDTL